MSKLVFFPAFFSLSQLTLILWVSYLLMASCTLTIIEHLSLHFGILHT